jgi:hypothetical protein
MSTAEVDVAKVILVILFREVRSEMGISPTAFFAL